MTVSIQIPNTTEQTIYQGTPVFVSQYATQRGQVKFPRSKKRRIRKKWAKQERNYGRTPGIFLLEGRLLVHPEVWKALKRHTQEK